MNKACTIFIPIYNEEDIIEKNVSRLKSYLREHEINAEIILGSNGSTDSTPEIIKNLEKTNTDIKSFQIGRAHV